MQKTTQNDILFDDATILENRFGKDSSNTNRDIAPNGDCTSYTLVDNGDCSN